MVKAAFWLIVVSMVLLAFNVPITDLLGPVFLVVIVLGAFMVLLGGKGSTSFGPTMLMLILVMVVPPFLYGIISGTFSTLSHRISYRFPSIALFAPIALILLFILAALVARALMTRSNRQRRLTAEDAIMRRARVAQRRRAIPETLGRENPQNAARRPARNDGDRPFGFFTEG